MKLKLFEPKKDYTLSKWDGGETEQLYIFPKDANYTKRNFGFRISKATIQKPKSDFTLLPNLERQLVLLEGCLLLFPELESARLLLPRDSYRFPGNLPIHCKGTGMDYNVMVRGKRWFETQYFDLVANETWLIEPFAFGQFLFLYVHTGELNLQLNGKRMLLKKGQSFAIESVAELLKIKVTAKRKCNFLLTEIEAQ